MSTKSAPALVDPYALSAAQLQEPTDYGLRYHIQLIPYLDGPAHIPWILKHPEYAKLREFPDSNYELCSTNPDSYKLLEGMYQDLLDANKGVNYFLLSTDEPYFAGMADNVQCHEKQRAQELGSRGKVLAEFVTKTAGYLHDRGREVIFWGEYPLVTTDIPSLPNYFINGELYGEAFDRTFKERGICQYIFTSNIEWKQFPAPGLLHSPLFRNPSRPVGRSLCAGSTRTGPRGGIVPLWFGPAGTEPGGYPRNHALWLGHSGDPHGNDVAWICDRLGGGVETREVGIRKN